MKLDQEKKYNLLCQHDGQPVEVEETKPAEKTVRKQTHKK